MDEKKQKQNIAPAVCRAEHTVVRQRYILERIIQTLSRILYELRLVNFHVANMKLENLEWCWVWPSSCTGGDGVQREAVRLRVPRQLVPPGDHAPDGQVLPHHHERPAGARRSRKFTPQWMQTEITLLPTLSHYNSSTAVVSPM